MHSYVYPTCFKIDTFVLGKFLQTFKISLAQTLISQPNMYQSKRFMDQNLSWLIEN